jgi:hypothetical protein
MGQIRSHGPLIFPLCTAAWAENLPRGPLPLLSHDLWGKVTVADMAAPFASILSDAHSGSVGPICQFLSPSVFLNRLHVGPGGQLLPPSCVTDPTPREITTRWRDSSGVLPAGPRFKKSAPRGIKIGAAPPQRTARREEINRESREIRRNCGRHCLYV